MSTVPTIAHPTTGCPSGLVVAYSRIVAASEILFSPKVTLAVSDHVVELLSKFALDCSNLASMTSYAPMVHVKVLALRTKLMTRRREVIAASELASRREPAQSSVWLNEMDPSAINGIIDPRAEHFVIIDPFADTLATLVTLEASQARADQVTREIAALKGEIDLIVSSPEYRKSHALRTTVRDWVMGVDEVKIGNSKLEHIAAIEKSILASGYTDLHKTMLEKAKNVEALEYAYAHISLDRKIIAAWHALAEPKPAPKKAEVVSVRQVRIAELEDQVRLRKIADKEKVRAERGAKIALLEREVYKLKMAREIAALRAAAAPRG